MSDVIRRALEEFLPDDDTVNAPDDPQLREVYLWLLERTDDRGQVPCSEAISDLAQKFSIKEKYVKKSRLKPLQREGWIQPNYTYIKVVEQTVDRESVEDE